MAHRLLEDQAGTVGGTYYSGASQNNDAQIRTIFCWGTFSGATVRVQYGPSAEGPWFDDKTGESTFQADDIRTIQLGAALYFRAVIDSAQAGTTVSLMVF